MKVSIVVPAYNTEKYIKRCVDSILNQTFKDFEIIIVNDGSTDNTSRIISGYIDDRVRCIDKKNGGVGSARNTGLQSAQGEYVTFVDSDDYINENYCSTLLHTIGDADIAVAGRAKYIDDQFVSAKVAEDVTYMQPVEALNCLMGGKLCTRPAWGKLYRRSLLENIRFTENHIFEEVRFSADTFANAKQIVFSDRTLYNYCIRAGSIMTTDYTRQVRDLTLAMEYVYQLLKETGLYSQCKNEFALWLARIAVSNMDLFSVEDVDIKIFKDASKRICNIYGEIGGLGGRR